MDDVTNERRRDESEEESEEDNIEENEEESEEESEEDIATDFVIQLDASDEDDSLSGAQDILM